MMKQWYERVPEIAAYNPKIDISPDNVRLSNNLSPLTNFFLNVFTNSLSDKDLIIAFPDIILKPIPLVSYLYSLEKNKDVLVFTQTNHQEIQTDPLIAHNRNYHLLNYGVSRSDEHRAIYHEGEYIFYFTPIGVLHDEYMKADVYLPRVNKRELKNKYIKQQRENFFSNKSRILLNGEEGKIYDFIDRLMIDGNLDNNLKIKINPKLIIFENVDRFIHSDYSAKLFVKWISYLLGDKRLIFHFSNPESKYIPIIKKVTDSLVIPMFKNNFELKKASISYFNEKRYPEESKILNKYNIDSLSLYKDIIPIRVIEPHLKAGNIDYYLQTSRNLLSRINEEDLVNKGSIYILKKLIIELPNLIINPTKYKIRYGDKFVNWGYYTIPQIINLFDDIVQEEERDTRILLRESFQEIICLYLELKECKRRNESKTFSRIGKDYEILNVINELIEKNDNKIIVGVQSSFEKRVFKEENEDLIIDDSLEIKAIDQIGKSNFERRNSILLLAGPLRLKHLSQLLLPYKEIIYMCYEGDNCKLIGKQIDLLWTYSQQSDLLSQNYLREIYEFLQVPKSNIFKGFIRFGERIKINHEDEELSAQWKYSGSNDGNFSDIIKNILEAMPQYKSYKEFEEEASRVENNVLEIDNKTLENFDNNSGINYATRIKNVESGEIIEKLLPAEKTYLYLENEEGEIYEGTPKVINPHYFIVILDNDVRISFLELIIDVFGMEDKIGKNLIEFWRNLLFRFIENNDLSYAEFYRMYKKIGGNREYQTVMGWAKGHVLGPLDPKDLYHIGIILNNRLIMDNFDVIYQEIQELRELHRNTGRKLKIIIKEILRGKLDPEKLSFEEFMFYDKVKNGIFEILEIRRALS